MEKIASSNVQDDTAHSKIKNSLSLNDAVVLIVGLVIGAGIFRTPSVVAANSSSPELFFLAWIGGGAVSLIGALCYAELTTAFPNAGGDYYFIRKAFGKKVSFLFVWSRLSVIQTGSIAILAYVFGDYLAVIFNVGALSSILYAATIVIILTAINLANIRFGTLTQKVFTTVEVGGILLVVVAGLFFTPDDAKPLQEASSGLSSGSFGLAMVFVLLTFGGWNEAAYISAETHSGSRTMAKALIVSILIITSVYLLINYTFVQVLGLENMGQSDAIASDLMYTAFGNTGSKLIGALVAVSAVTSINATIFTGARSTYALGRDYSIFAPLGKWNSQTSVPTTAFIVQAIVSLLLISLGLLTRDGFETVIEYTAPVFWFFFLLVGISIFVLRKKEPSAKRPFKVPLYPVTPILFCLTCAYLLYSSIMHTGIGALVGIAVLLVGFIPLYFQNIKNKKSIHIH
ncbi:APC family permease [Albibacterium indicum]|uniref:APC family permease n=1 Tax=Albibacterium indicum TaxID=2292082 RepID=UPI000E46DA97|nr:amino acid permease [Pedobacter indicus]